ncbi:FAD-dependent monooxygenase [Streptoalloteichus hindustanus]|uniref:2-polyprenyl-6-methoxyphenol hydroxylase n=1 Tax=Streptoalloteichus hindustanus TaxID=2017 RepID=A0A1M5CKU7_STRHI|nr:FAD-dependent monooxygenase [Streptoalloteichus hindustanus]SHF55330.1 2-polyprenyl-6-methoxyphenol hydroxylase [Streptoalloteichus hindustanus]
MPTPHTEVLVVGGGPVGLLLGCELARRGVAVRVVDRRATRVPTGARGRALSARSLEILDDLGVVDEVHARGRRDPKAYLYEGDTVVRELDPGAESANRPTPDAPHRCSFVELPQQSTEEILSDRLASWGVRVEFDHELVDLDDRAGRADLVVATVRTAGVAHQITARYVVGCDGASSRVRELAGISFQGHTRDTEHFITGCAEIDGLDPSHLHIWSTGTMLTWQRDLDGWVFFARVHPDDTGQIPAPTTATLRRIFAAECRLPGVTFGATWATSTWRPNIRMADRYRQGRVLVAGDAAHVHPPTGGQGMNTGLQDAYNLGWKLAHVLRGAPASLVDTYEAERLPVARSLLATSTRRYDTATREESGRGNLEVATDAFSAKDKFADITQLSIGYPDSPLSRDLDETTGIRAGDRAPDAPGLRVRDTTTSLFELFRGPHLTLLRFGQPTASPTAHADTVDIDPVRVITVVPPGTTESASDNVVVDTEGHAHRAYGITGPASVLVRPDGHVGFTASQPTGTALTDYLRLLTAPRSDQS